MHSDHQSFNLEESKRRTNSIIPRSSKEEDQMGFISLTSCSSMRSPAQAPIITLRRLVVEALILPLRRGLLLPAIILLSLLHSSLLFFANLSCISLSLLDLNNTLLILRIFQTDQELTATATAARKNIMDITITESVFLLISFLTSPLLLIALIHASSITYSNRKEFIRPPPPPAKKLSWKVQMIITQIYVTVMNFCCAILLAALPCFVLITTVNGRGAGDTSKIFITVVTGLEFVMIYLYLRMTMVWSLTSVVSMVEYGCYGMEAMERAIEICREERRRRHGMAISLVSSCGLLAGFVLPMVYVPQITDHQWVNLFFLVNVSMCLYVFSVMAYVVLYFESKRCNGEKASETSLQSLIKEDFP